MTLGITHVCCVQPEVTIMLPVKLPALPVNPASTRPEPGLEQCLSCSGNVDDQNTDCGR